MLQVQMFQQMQRFNWIILKLYSCIYRWKFDKDISTYAYGFCVVKEGQVVYEENGFGNNPKEAELCKLLRNNGSWKSHWMAINQGEFEVVIFHDCEGVAKLTKSKEDGGWERKQPVQ